MMKARTSWLVPVVSLAIAGASGCSPLTPEEKAAVAEIERCGGRYNPGEWPITSVYLGNSPRSRANDATLARLKALTILENLSVENSQITDAGLAHLAGLTHLQTLSFSGTKVTDASLVHMKGLTSLRGLFLFATPVTDAGVKKLQKALPKCIIQHHLL